MKSTISVNQNFNRLAILSRPFAFSVILTLASAMLLTGSTRS